MNGYCLHHFIMVPDMWGIAIQDWFLYWGWGSPHWGSVETICLGLAHA